MELPEPFRANARPRHVREGIYPAPCGGINALIVGAGLTKAVFPAAPTWGELLRRIAKKLGVKLGNSTNWFVEGLRLSRSASPRRRNAQSTPFQDAVKEEVERTTALTPSADNAPRWEETAEALKRFITAANISVIVDTNYDTTLERLLEDAEIRFTRVVGSEGAWVGPLPTGETELVIWKIHGFVDAPSTIVLSPTEYQRLYEANALGPALQQLGSGLERLWVVGCGLNDDETWAYLCSDKGPEAVLCLWLTTDTEIPKTAPDLWLKQVYAKERRVKVYWDTVVGEDPAHLASHLTHIATSVTSAKSSIRSDWWRKRINEFEADYKPLASALSAQAAISVVDRFRADFEALRGYLLSRSAAGTMPTWCSGLITNSPSNPAKRVLLAQDFAAVTSAAVKFCDDWAHQCGGQLPIIVAAASQAAVAYVVDLAEALGIGVSIEMSDVDTQNLALDERQSVLVGLNPFFMRASQLQRANPMHVHTTERRLSIAAPFTSEAKKRAEGLLTEDEWEACIVHLFHLSNPRLVFEGVSPIDVGQVPPLYPWGFRLYDLREYRARSKGSVSTRWHLVSNIEGDWQVCKGGGLRDNGRIAFRIGNRGRVRIGEFDAFLEPAYRHE